MDARRFAEIVVALERETAKVFVESRTAVRLAGGLHVLIEDIPGVGKTTLALALARAAGMSFSRIQFTPDLLPGDVLGMNVWDAAGREFVFKDGPVYAHCVLADELNRTSPRTQSAFLEAMQDGQVTVDGRTRPLPEPFFLIGTQNPATFAGTFPLPEAELDRFGLSFSIGYPSPEGEREILRRRFLPGANPLLGTVVPVTGPEEISQARRFAAEVHVAEPVRDYIVSIVRATRTDENIRLGASPRAAVFLQQASRARAAAEGRDFVMPEDAESLAPAVLAHRIQLSSRAKLGRIDGAACVRTICAGIPKPTGL
jgi:MoxR-like ATPase